MNTVQCPGPVTRRDLLRLGGLSLLGLSLPDLLKGRRAAAAVPTRRSPPPAWPACAISPSAATAAAWP
jgi:hypothetical protein